MKFPREIWVPKGAVKVTDKQSDAVAYLYEATRLASFTPKYGALVFVGKQTKPLWHYTYKNAGVREAAIRQAFLERRASLTYRAGVQAERTGFVHDYKVGDIFRTSWGYEQTNVEYFEVIEVKGKYLILRELQQATKETGWLQGTCIPLPGKFASPRYEGDDRGVPIRRLAQKGHVKIDDVRYGWPIKPDTDGYFREVSWSAYH